MMIERPRDFKGNQVISKGYPKSKFKARIRYSEQ